MTRREIIKDAFDQLNELCSIDDNIDERMWNHGILLVQHHQETILSQQAEPHPDDKAIDAFAAALKKKMAVSRAKGRSGWENPDLVSDEQLAHMLVSHMSKGNAGTFEDLAIFCMMLHQRNADPQVILDVMGKELTTETMTEGLKLHHLKHEGHSQLADGFRAGANWAVENCRPCKHNFAYHSQRNNVEIYTCTKCNQISAFCSDNPGVKE